MCWRTSRFPLPMGLDLAGVKRKSRSGPAPPDAGQGTCPGQRENLASHKMAISRGTPFNNSQTSGMRYHMLRASRASFLLIEGRPRLPEIQEGVG